MKKISILTITCAAFVLAACGGGDDDKKEHPLEAADKLYDEGLQKFGAREFKDAAKSFDEVERQHPSSEWAPRAEIMSAYSSFRDADYDTASGTLDHYVKLYPNSNSTAYAYYMIALCYYEQISDVGRDQKITEKALQSLREVIRRFPDTEYARDAKIKEDLTIDHLAGKEMEIGRYYLRHDDYLAAINRFRYVVETYQTTTHVPEALHRLVESYLKMGVPDEARRYAAVLGYNYPGSVWYKDSYKLMNSDASHPKLVKPVEEPVVAAAPKPADSANLTIPPDSKAGDTSWWNFWDGSAAPVAAEEKHDEEPKPAPVVVDTKTAPAAGATQSAAAPTAEIKPAEENAWWDFWDSNSAEVKAEDAPAAPAATSAVPAPAQQAAHPAETAPTVPPVNVTPQEDRNSGGDWWKFWGSDAKAEPEQPAAQQTPATAQPVTAQPATDVPPAGDKHWWDSLVP